MVTPVISLDKSLDGYLGISDITPYAAGERDLTGIMVFWSSDAFAADFNVDQSNADSWSVPVGAQQTISVYALYNYTWDALNNIDFGQFGIVFYNGVFYIKTTTGTINPSSSGTNPALDVTDFSPLVVGQPLTIGSYVYTALTIADIYALAGLSVAAVGATSIATTAITFIDRDAFVLSKTDCLKWEVAINISCVVVRTRLYNYDGTLLVEGLPFAGTTVIIDLSAYGDGSYTFELAYVNNGNQQHIPTPTSWIVVTIPILETCKANACYTKLFKYTLCTCDDPCDDCDDNKAKKHDLLMIRELVTSINQMVYLQKSQYVGLYPITKSESDLLTDIGQMIDKLKIVTDRCGLCGGSNNINITC